MEQQSSPATFGRAQRRRDLTGNFAGGLYGLALLSLIAAIVCAFFLHIPHPEEAGSRGWPARTGVAESLLGVAAVCR